MRIPIFDLDGTLLDSDAALLDAFVALGVAPEDVTYGHVVGAECERLGISLVSYLDAYDTGAAAPFPGVEDLVAALSDGRWAVCSNKATRSAAAELARLGWQPTVALFTEDFAGPKRLAPVLDALGVGADAAVFIGDTAHDRRCAAEADVPFLLAGWNPRVRPEPGDTVVRRPADLLAAVAAIAGRPGDANGRR